MPAPRRVRSSSKPNPPAISNAPLAYTNSRCSQRQPPGYEAFVGAWGEEIQRTGHDEKQPQQCSRDREAHVYTGSSRDAR